MAAEPEYPVHHVTRAAAVVLRLQVIEIVSEPFAISAMKPRLKKALPRKQAEASRDLVTQGVRDGRIVVE